MSNETKSDRRAHAAAKADINLQLKKKANELQTEKEQLESRIKGLEIEAARETNDERVMELLAERAKHAARIEAIPFFMRNAKIRALQAQADALEEEAEDVKVDLDAAQTEVEKAEARASELTQLLDEVNQTLPALTQRRDALEHNHRNLVQAASGARGDARCVEMDRPLISVPNRFDGIC